MPVGWVTRASTRASGCRRHQPLSRAAGRRGVPSAVRIQARGLVVQEGAAVVGEGDFLGVGEVAVQGGVFALAFALPVAQETEDGFEEGVGAGFSSGWWASGKGWVDTGVLLRLMRVSGAA